MRRVGLPSSSPREEEALKTLWGWLQLLETPSEELRRPGQGLVFVCAVQASTRKLLEQLRYLIALIYLHFLFFGRILVNNMNFLPFRASSVSEERTAHQGSCGLLAEQEEQGHHLHVFPRDC